MSGFLSLDESMIRDRKHFIDIRPCAVLRRLTLYDMSPTVPSFQEAQDIISQVASNQLEDLVLELKLKDDDPSWVDRVDFKGIEQLLKAPRFCKLRRLIVGCSNCDLRPYREVYYTVEHAIQGARPLLSRKGILGFNHGEYLESCIDKF